MDNERTATITIGDEEYTLLLTTKATKEIAGRYGGLAMVDYITVHSKKDIRVIFKERLRRKTSSWDSGLRKSLPTFCTQLQLMANKPFN